MNDNEQRDEWARIIVGELYPGPQDDPMTWPAQVWRLADAIVERIKPRTITTVEELDALPNGSAILDISGDVAQRLCAWWHFPETSPMGSSKVLKYSSTVTVIHEPEAEATR